MCITYVLIIPESSVHFWPLTRFLTETETWLYQEDDPWTRQCYSRTGMKMHLTFSNGDVINDVMSAWRITCTTIHFQPIYLQTIVYAVSFNLIQIVGIMPNKHTNTICEDITSLSRVMNKMNTDKHDQIWTHTPKYIENVCSSSTFNMHVHVVGSPDWPGHSSCYLQHSRRKIA